MFYYPGELSNAEFESTESKSTLLTNEEVHNVLRSQQQANRRSRGQRFRMNCPIINLLNIKQTGLDQTHQRIHRGSKACKRVTRRKLYDISFSSSFQSFWEKFVKPENSQTYPIYSRINCSAVATTVLFVETKLSRNVSSFIPFSSSR